MRVANNSLFNAVTNNIMRNQERFLKLGESISSGKRLHQLSSDPPALSQALRFRSSIASVTQYQQNIDRSHSWLNMSEISLAQVEDVLMRAKELAVSQSSGTADTTSRAAAAVELDTLIQQTLQAGNAKLGNQFLFAGRKTNVEPFQANGAYQGDGGNIDVEIGQDNFMSINSRGDEVFRGVGGDVDVIGVLQTLKTSLETDDRGSVEGLLNPLDQSLNQIVTARSGVGAKMSRLDAERSRLAEVSDLMTQMLGETEGADLAKTVSDLTQQQYVYEASLAASAKMLQPTLLDFLR
jgi:flagellar hook-associated protein 3 FlgL